ncbi:HAMP domain-containing histidine kinase [Microbacterium lacus]|uniref:sensor histidine kinase n=1 Tax=Microbacterium lacus TaxID=415217 RepID=UPI00384D1AEF
MTRSSRPISARARILAAVLAVACLGLAIVGSVTFVVQHSRVTDEIDQRLSAQVARLQTVAAEQPDDTGSAGGAAPATDDLVIEEFSSVEDYLQAAVARLVPARNEGSVAIVDGEARFRPATLSGFDISDDHELIARAVAETTAAGGTVRGTAETEHGSMRYVAIPVNVEGDPAQGVYLRVVDLNAELAPVTAAMFTYAIAAVGVLLAIGIVGWFVAGRLLSPLGRLRATADAVSVTDLSPRMAAGGNDDISDLSRTVNSMLDRIEGSVDSQRQLLDDVRHELKTPITIVRGHLELMDPTDAHDVATARAIGIAELDRMTRLVEDIDLLASVEGGTFATVEVDLAALTARVGELVSVIPGHPWLVSARAEGKTLGDQDRLLQAWLQLADNAAKYTAEGSPIEIGSRINTDEVCLWVVDHGPGIPPASRQQIFRRFGRAQGRRSVGGSGLGLAIVDAIAKAHGGRCLVTDTPGGGATFTIHLPLRATALPAPVRAGDVLQREAAA